jgi:hypothetical protein
VSGRSRAKKEHQREEMATHEESTFSAVVIGLPEDQEHHLAEEPIA